MSQNHLEQLVAEWLCYTGHAVWTNCEVRRGEMDGNHWELDIIALNPTASSDEVRVIHVECADQAPTSQKYEDKFRAARFWIARRLGVSDHAKILHLGLARTGTPTMPVGSRFERLDSFLSKIATRIRADGLDYHNRAISQSFPLLRTLNLAIAYPTVFHNQPSPTAKP